MNLFLTDLRHASRKLMAMPLLTGAIVLSLGLGIGANVTVFRFVEPIFLRPLPVEDSDRLVQLFTTDRVLGEVPTFGALLPVSRLNYEDVRDHGEWFEGLASYQSIFLNWYAGDRARRVEAEVVSGEYFPVLGVEPVLGRAFSVEEGRPDGGANVVVVGHGFWLHELGGRRGVVGETLTLNNRAFEIIGVAPAGFRGISPLVSPDLWVPVGAHATVLTGQMAEFFDNRRTLSFNVVGRLRPGVSLSEARSRLDSLAARLEAAHPEANRERGLAVMPLAEANIPARWRETFSIAGGLLLVVTGLVVLVACGNVANLLLARLHSRRTELAVRIGIGARRMDVARPVLAEVLLLSITGAGIAAVLSRSAAVWLWARRPPELEQASLDLGLNFRVVLFTLLVAAIAGAVFGVVPIMRAARQDVVGILKGSLGASRKAWFRFSLPSLLVAFQVALCIVTVVGASLFLDGLHAIRQVDPKLDVEKLGVVTFEPAAQGYDRERSRQLFRRLLLRVENLPQVTSAALGTHVPLSLIGASLRSPTLEGEDPGSAQGTVIAGATTVTPGFFEAVGLELVEGRGFDASDRQTTRRVVIVNRTMSERLGRGGGVVGRRFRIPGVDSWFEIVGVVEDSKYVRIAEESQPYFYVPLEQNVPDGVVSLFVRSDRDPADALRSVQREIVALDPTLPLIHVWSLEQVLDRSLAAPRLAAGLFGVFAGLALLLTTVGIYGVVSHSVARRKRDIAVRMALGADRGATIASVLRRSVVPVSVGLIVGTMGAIVESKAIASVLYGIEPRQMWAHFWSVAIMAVVALVATLVPAYRASRLHPMRLLRP